MGSKELKSQLQIFEGFKVRAVWDDDAQEWFFSVVDVVAVLTEQPDYSKSRKYWNKLKQRLVEEGYELVTNCHQLKLVSPKDGKRYLTDVAEMKGMFRIIQSIPSPKAEPFKQWMAQVAAQRIDQMLDPELSIDQAVADYRRLGYSESWINQRLKTIEIRKGLTDEWKRGGVTEAIDFATLTDLMSKTWSGMTTREYKRHKGLTKESLRDNMTNMELLLNALAEETATQLSKERNPDGLIENAAVAKEGAEVARDARENVEKRLGRSVISSERAIDHTNPSDSLSLNEPGDFGDNEDIL
ncbi:MAG: Bro-N domain-containing protein [Bacteroidaceae bacterium]|nr:Bro-N domain-containing protein [Bacteroidaceae bacterium]